jgi:transposase
MFVNSYADNFANGQFRYYEPVTESVPGVQCQVDPGELRGVMISGLERLVHFVVFVVFVLSCSRLMYIGLAFRPLDTERFIQMHDEAFRYFGGVTEAGGQCVDFSPS